MKPKSALFISAVLTAFVLVIVGSVVSSFTAAKTSQAVAPTQEMLAIDIPTQVDPTATAAAPVTPEQAASIAAQYMKKTDVYSVESASLNGVNVFKVVFSAGDVVYVGLDGNVISTETLQPTTVYVEPTSAPQKHQGGGNGGSGGGHEHEKEQEHEHD